MTTPATASATSTSDQGASQGKYMYLFAHMNRVSNHISATTYIRMSISPQPQEL